MRAGIAVRLFRTPPAHMIVRRSAKLLPGAGRCAVPPHATAMCRASARRYETLTRGSFREAGVRNQRRRRRATSLSMQRRFRWHRAEDGAIVTVKNAHSWGSNWFAKMSMVLGSASIVASIAYFAYAQEEMLITGRRRFVPISRGWEWYLGVLFEKHTLANYDVVPSETPLARRVAQLAMRVAGAAEKLGVHYPWKVIIVKSDDHSAECFPGGVIVVCTGLVMHLGELVAAGVFDSMDDALGTILCHEIAHAVARHQVEGLALQPWALMLEKYGRPWELFSTFALALPYKRQQEREADIISVHLMALCGLDIEAPMKLFLNVRTTSTGALGSFAATHPSDSERALTCARTADIVREKYGIPRNDSSMPAPPEPQEDRVLSPGPAQTETRVVSETAN